MNRTRTETRWVIVYDQGPGFQRLYTGQWLTRKAAIRQHVCDLNGELPTRFEERQRWAMRKLEGDRCIKATITWEEPAR